MTENERIKKHIEDCEHRIGNILGFMESNSDADIFPCEENIAVLKEVIIALEEIQQYRVIGTPEYIVNALDEQLGGLNILDVLKRLTELEQYRAIGTVEDIQLIFSLCKDLERMVKKYESIGTIEEFKALKEKSEPKKPIPLDKRGEYWKCPTCGKYAVNNFGCKYKFCPNCGTGFDWE